MPSPVKLGFGQKAGHCFRPVHIGRCALQGRSLSGTDSTGSSGHAGSHVPIL